MDELDSVPNIDKLSSGIDHLTNGKAAGSDNIPLDLIKTYKSALLLPLHENSLIKHYRVQLEYIFR